MEPSVEKLIRDVEAAERAALKTALAELRSQRGANEQLSRPLEVKEREGSTLLVAKAPIVGTAFPGVFIYQGRVDSAIGGANTTALIGGLVSGLSDIFVPHLEVGANLSKSVREKEGGASTTMSVEIGRANDGSTKLGLGMRQKLRRTVSPRARILPQK